MDAKKIWLSFSNHEEAVFFSGALGLHGLVLDKTNLKHILSAFRELLYDIFIIIGHWMVKNVIFAELFKKTILLFLFIITNTVYLKPKNKKYV